MAQDKNAQLRNLIAGYRDSMMLSDIKAADRGAVRGDHDENGSPATGRPAGSNTKGVRSVLGSSSSSPRAASLNEANRLLRRGHLGEDLARGRSG